MKYVRLMDSRKRDARIQAVSPRKPRLGDYRNQQGAEVRSFRFINDTERHNPQNLIDQVSDMDELADRLIKDDPEIDLEIAGRMIDQASQVWISGKGKVMHSARMMDIVYTPEGDVKAKKDFVNQEPTVTEDIALPWTGKLIPVRQVLQKFVLVRKLQLCHLDGLTFDFLHGMAKELQEKDSMLLLGGGPKGKQPLIFQRNGSPFRGFLEGRVKSDSYLLVLHLSNLELKRVDQ